MSRAFYNLPAPGDLGLKWKPYQQAREKVTRIERRLREAQAERARLEGEIKKLDDTEISELARAVLEGTDDPSTRHDEHQRLVDRLRDLRREEVAVSQALPSAEEQIRQTVFEYQHRWKEEVNAALEKTIEEEHKAYQKAIEIIEGPRSRRMYLEALGAWVRYPTPTFGPPSDVLARSAIQKLAGDAVLAEEKMHERSRSEQELAQAQQEGVA